MYITCKEDARKWFKSLPSAGIATLASLEDACRYESGDKDYQFMPVEFSNIKKNENGNVCVFNKSFFKTYARIYPSIRPAKTCALDIYFWAFNLEFDFILGKVHRIMDSKDLRTMYILAKNLESFLIQEETKQDDSFCVDCSTNTKDYQPLEDLACEEDSDDKEDLSEKDHCFNDDFGTALSYDPTKKKVCDNILMILVCLHSLLIFLNIMRNQVNN